MSWVRLEDRFPRNRKIVELSDAEFRTWVRLLCHCAEIEDPTVDAKTRREIAGLTPKRIQRFAELGLLDRVNGCHEVHDWSEYVPKDATSAERTRRWRARQASPKASQEPSPKPAPPRDRVRTRSLGSGSSSSENEERFAVQAEASYVADSTPFVAPELRSH